MGTLNRIELDPKVCNGKPVIRGTRIPVSVVLERLAAHESWQTILSAHPELKEEAFRKPFCTHAHPWTIPSSRSSMPNGLKLYLDQMFGVDVAAALRRVGVGRRRWGEAVWFWQRKTTERT
jgi:uncharacterized protein (DUF433 family)